MQPRRSYSCRRAAPRRRGERWMLVGLGLRARSHDAHAWWRAPAAFWPTRAPRAAFLSPAPRCAATSTPSRSRPITALVRRFQPTSWFPIWTAKSSSRGCESRRASVAPAPTAASLDPATRQRKFPLKNKRHYRIVYTADVRSRDRQLGAAKRTMMRDAPLVPRRGKAVVVYNGIDVGPYEALAARRDEVPGQAAGALIGAPATHPWSRWWAD